MEQFKEIISLYWPQILECAMFALCYFLVFLFRNKVNGSTKSMRALFKENVDTIINEKTTMQTELTVRKQEYDRAIAKVETLEQQIKSLTKILTELTEEVDTDAELFEDQTN